MQPKRLLRDSCKILLQKLNNNDENNDLGLDELAGEH